MAKNVELLLAQSAGPDVPQLDPWKLRCWRTLRGLSQHQLAADLAWGKCGNQILCRIENWAVPVGKVRLAAFARALDCKVADLTSSGAELQRSRSRFDAWQNAGRPDLRSWVASQGG